MKKIIIVICCLIHLRGLAQDKFEISGTLSRVRTGCKIVLEYKNSNGEEVRDSTKIKNGKFMLCGNTAFGNKASISLLPINKANDKPGLQRDEQLFFLEKGHYIIKGRGSIAKAMLIGTKSQEEYIEYRHLLSNTEATYPQLYKRMESAIVAKDSTEMEKIRIDLITTSTQMSAIRDSFIFSHPDSYVTLGLVAYEVSAVQNPKYYNILSNRMLSTIVGQRLTDRVKKGKLIAVGKIIDFTQPDDKGNLFTLSSLRGKYVLVDFWASWCGPCRSESPFLIRAYHTLKDQNFEIVSISLDATKAAWLKAVKEDQLPWIQISDLKGVKNEVAERFGISSIPQNVLIAPNGIIIAKNLRGEDVTERIAELIKSKSQK